MNTGKGPRFNSIGHQNISSSQQGTYDAGLYLAENIGETSSHKMPIYDKRTNEGAVRSSPTDLSHHNRNFHDGNPNSLQYRGQGRSSDYEGYNSSYYQNPNTPEVFENSQYRRHSRNHESLNEVTSTSHSSEFMPFETPSTEDVKTIAFQMRTMPNYFAAMAAAASLNVNYPQLATENDPEYPSHAQEGQQIKPSYRSRYYEDRHSNNASSSHSRRDNLGRTMNIQGEPMNNDLPRPRLDMNSELQDMLTNRSAALSGSEIDDLDNPKHKYYLKVCYICKETTTKEHCIHYGALACFSCRAFFRRSHQSMQDKGPTPDGKRRLPEFVCKKSGKCNVTPKTRRRCQKCRYDLCIKAGMQPEAVMTEDQVKVRFRKMFTKRGENKNKSEEENKNNQTIDEEIFPPENLSDPERRESIDSSSYQQEKFGEVNRFSDTRLSQNTPVTQGLLPTIMSPEYQCREAQELNRNSYVPQFNHESRTSFSREDNGPDANMVISNTFNTAVQEKETKETSSLRSSEENGQNFYSYQNISKKKRILDSFCTEYENDINIKSLDQTNSWQYDQTNIKQESSPQSFEKDVDFFSYSDEEKTTSLDVNEPQVQLVEFDEIKKEVQSPESFTSINDVSTSMAEIDEKDDKNDGEMITSNYNSEEDIGSDGGQDMFDSNDNIQELISNDENKTNLKTEDLSPRSDTAIDPFDDFENRIDFDKIIGPNVQCVDTKQRTPSPPVFKSPTLPISLTIKGLKMNLKSISNIDTNIKTDDNDQNPDDNEGKINRYNRMCKRIANVEASYKIASSQLSFPDSIVNKLINFHLGYSTAQKEHYLSCALSVSKFFRHFALMQRDFGNLLKCDQMLLLGKNTPLYVQFVFASYFCQTTGHEQLSTLIGEKYIATMENQNTNCHVLKKISATEFCHSVKLFSNTASLSDWEKMLNTFKRIKIESKYIPYLCLLILYDTNNSMFGNSQDDDSSPGSIPNRPKFEDSLKDCKKVQEIRRKVEKMLSFFSYELISPPSKENDPISSLLYENNETLKKINNLISVLGNLSMFYTYNTNWANNSIPGYCQNESDVVVDTLKNQSQHKNALVSAGTYTFHLSMPYTHEEELWLENKFDLLKKSYASVSIGEELVNEFVMYSFDVPLSKKFFPLCHNAFLERSWRIYRNHTEFKALTVDDQNTIWKTNANKANALFMVRSQICKNGLVQLQDCIGELDNKQFAERYLPLLKTAKLRKMSFFDAVFSSGISIPEDLMNQAKSLIQQIGPYVEDQEYLQLIVLLQMLKPPKKWIDPTTEFLSPAQKNLIKLYEKYWILIHRRLKWKIKQGDAKPSQSMGQYKAEEMNPDPEITELSRRRKRKASQNEDVVGNLTSKTVILSSSSEKLNVMQSPGEQENSSALIRVNGNMTNAELMLNDELAKLNNNDSEENIITITGKNKVDLNEFEQEEGRLNSEAWQHFEKLTSVVTKIEKLSEIFDEIQGLLQEVVINKGGLAIPIETTPLMPIDI